VEEVTAKRQMEKVRRFENGFMAIHLIHLGNKLGILEALTKSREGLMVADLAASLHLHEPGLQTWCQTAYHFEILDCDDQGRFSLQPFMDEILGDKNHFRNYLATIEMDVELIGKSMDEAVHFYRTGEVINSYIDPEMSKMAYANTKNIYLAFLFMILPKNEPIKKMLDDGIRLLDIGCGDGSLIVQLAQAFPQSRFVGVNPDRNGIETALAAISQLGLGNRVFVENKGGEALTYTDEFDLISMVVTLHEIIPNIRKSVMQKAYEALKPGGTLLILDFPYPGKLEDFRNPNYDYGILDQFYETSIGTVHLTAEEQDELINQAGFKNMNRIAIAKGMFDLITASK
jgi:ubiquinone/menaquinone biosynthesis C-methylase UbiE